MDSKIANIIAGTLNIGISQVNNTIILLNEGATVPFISRYRKEQTGSLDEVQVLQVREQLDKLTDLEKRKETILKSINEQDQLTPELKQRIETCYNPVELEDIYLPYKPKRRTKAAVAREKGLEPLAKILMKQNDQHPEERAEKFLTEEIVDVDSALAGARDIIAEWF